MGFLLFVPAIIIVIIIIIALIIANSKAKWEEEGDEVVKNVYQYVVLFATLMMVIGGSVAAFMAVADLISPSPYYQSFEEFRQMNISEDNKNIPPRSEEDLRLAYDAMVEQNMDQEKNRAVNTLIKSFGWIIIPLPIFIYFQRKIWKKD